MAIVSLGVVSCYNGAISQASRLHSPDALHQNLATALSPSLPSRFNSEPEPASRDRQPCRCQQRDPGAQSESSRAGSSSSSSSSRSAGQPSSTAWFRRQLTRKLREGRHSSSSSAGVAQRHSSGKLARRVTEAFLEENPHASDAVPRALDLGKCGMLQREGNVGRATFGVVQKPLEHGVLQEAEGKQTFDLAKALSQMLPFVVVATAASALMYPPSFTWFTKPYYAPALGGIMLSIGLKLSPEDFLLAVKRPGPVLLGLSLQYVVKPLIGLMLAALFRIPAPYAAGFILTASVAGAQLSSYASYLGDGDMALSILLTSISTVLAVIVTPLLSQLLIGAVVPVDPIAMAKSIMQVVIVPVGLGLALNTYAKPAVKRISPFTPLLALVCTSLCIGSPLAFNQSRILTLEGLHLLLPVIAFHAATLASGFWLSRVPLWRQSDAATRTLSLCSGMQSSTLAMLLASQFLGCTHAVPPSISVVVMSVMGLSLGAFWGQGHKLQNLLPDKWSWDLKLST